MTDLRDPVRDRYEAIYLELRRSALAPLVACWITTALVAAALVLVTGPVSQWMMTDLGVPPPIAIIVWAGFFIAAVTVIPSLIQLALISPERRAAMEALNTLTIREQERFRAETARALPRFRTRKAAQKWVSTHPSWNGPPAFQARLLAWVGDLPGASAIVEGMDPTTPFGRFEQRLLAAVLQFLSTGHADFAETERLRQLVPGEEGQRARLALAFEYSRVAAALGEDWARPLATARSELHELPSGASMRDRMLRGNAPLAVVMAAAFAVGFVTSR